MSSYIVQEEDGTSKFTLEEGGGSLLTEESSAGVASDTAQKSDSSAPFLLFLGSN